LGATLDRFGGIANIHHRHLRAFFCQSGTDFLPNPLGSTGYTGYSAF
jgi:hypothetical protein